MAVPVFRSLKEAHTLPLSYLFKKGLGGRLVQDSIEIAKKDELFTMKLPGTKYPLAIVTRSSTARELLTNTDKFQKMNGVNLDGSRDGSSSPLLDPLGNTEGGYEQKNVVVLEGEEWQRQRKLMNPSFTSSTLNALVPTFAEKSDLVLDIWKNHEEEPRNICQDMSHFAVEVLGSALLGKSFGTLDNFDGEKDQEKEIYTHYMRTLKAFGEPLYVLFPFLEKLPLPRNINLKRSVAFLVDEFTDAVNKRYDKKETMSEEELQNFEPNNILDFLIFPKKGEALTKKELLPNVWVFFIAGHDTTAVALMWTLRYLAMFPDVQEKVREEVLGVIGKNGIPTADDITDDKMPYLASCIKESLRLQPPVHNLVTRQCVQDCTLGNYQISAGTKMSVAISAINRDPENWENPHSFFPERYLTEKRAFNPSPFKWLPFSGGMRRCLGDRFSLMEQKTFLSQLIARYSLIPANGVVGVGDRGRDDPEDRSFPRQPGTFELIFNQPKEINLKFKPL